VKAWVFGEALEWLQAEGVPLWVSVADNPVAEVAELLARFPELDAVLVGAHYTHASVVRPLLRHLPRSRLELSRYEGLGEVEALAREFGSERLLYGSFYPRYALGPILHYLHETDLPEGALAGICGGNLDRLLGTAP